MANDLERIKTVLNNHAMTWEARGFMAYLLSRPKQQTMGPGREIIEELVYHEYIIVTSYPSNGFDIQVLI